PPVPTLHLPSFPTRRSSDLQVGSLQTPVTLCALDDLPLRTDVDLLAPIDLAVGELAAQPGVSAKLWALELADLILGLDRQSEELDRKSTRLNSSHVAISYAV